MQCISVKSTTWTLALASKAQFTSESHFGSWVQMLSLSGPAWGSGPTPVFCHVFNGQKFRRARSTGFPAVDVRSSNTGGTDGDRGGTDGSPTGTDGTWELFNG